MRIERTYEMATDVPPPLTWESYAQVVRSSLAHTLASSPSEADMQALLEEHPSLLPAPYGCFGEGAHGSESDTVLSQPELPGFRPKRPDFMIVSRDSGSVYPILIEIESPAKRWFTAHGRPSAELTQAMDQLTQWADWFSLPENQVAFSRLYNINQSLICRQLRPRFVLIMGRRSEAAAVPAFARKRALLERPDTLLMTYDRLNPSFELRNYVSAKLVRLPGDRASVEVLHVPACLQLSPCGARAFSGLRGREQAIERNPLISRERKQFLIGRIPYWDDWAQECEGVIGSERE